MNAVILAKGAILQKIKLSLHSLSGCFHNGPLSISCERSKIAEADAIFAETSELSSISTSDLERVSLGRTEFYVYFHGMFIDAKSEEQFQLLESSLIHEEDWLLLKEVNELKIELNYLFRKTFLHSYPTFMQMELTDACNAECIMCSHLYQKNAGAGMLSKKGFEAVRPILPYVRVAILHGNGEPFLHPMLSEILENYCKYKIYISTSTNLSVFNEEIASYINRCFADIRVSCDGCTKEIYEQIRRNLSFEMLIKNLEQLHALCPNTKKMLMVVMMRQNIHQIDQFVPFAKKFGFSEVVFSNMMPSIALGNDADSPLHYKPVVRHKLRTAVRLGEKLGVKVVYPDCYDDFEEESDAFIEPTFRSEEEIEQQRHMIRSDFHHDRVPLEQLKDCDWCRDQVPCKGVCDWCMERTYIDLHGNVFVCCINNRYTLGNILECGFEQTWNCAEMQRVRKSFFEGKLPDFCEGCNFVLSRTLPHLQDVDRTDAFFAKRCISEVYREHTLSTLEG